MVRFLEVSVLTFTKKIVVFLCISLSSLSLSDNNTQETLINKLNVTVNVPKLNGLRNVTVQDITEEGEKMSRSASIHPHRKNILLGIYKNYKNTFLVNRTLSRYRKISHNQRQSTLSNLTSFSKSRLSGSLARSKKRRKNRVPLNSYDGEYRYNFGEGVNLTLDMNRDIVSVNLDEDCLRDVLTDFSFDDYDDEGRKKQDDKKNDMMSKVMPLLILPFLIQSAIIPFIVAKLKLLLLKSILVGKLAIFLLVITTIKNNQRMNNYEPSPSHWAWEPSRRSDVIRGYQVEGRPHIWVSK